MTNERCGRRVALLCAAMIQFLSPAPRTLGSDDWPQFRGADSRGVAESSGFPAQWSEKENILWSQAIEGRGWSSPIVTRGRVYLTTVTREDGQPEEARPGLYFGGNRETPASAVHVWQLWCLDLETGQRLWERTLHRGIPETPRHIKNSYASETPVTDGENVYVLLGDVGVFCLTTDGTPVWSKELPSVATRFGWGTAASPVLHGDRLYFVSDNEEASYLMALDKRSGSDVFRVDRDEGSNWSTPFIWENELRTEIVTAGSDKVRAYDLNGKLLYEFGGCSTITIATPYAVDGLLYVSSGYINDPNRPIFALRPGGAGEISLAGDETSNAAIAWCQKQAAPYNPSTLVYDGALIALYDQGMVARYDAATGREIQRRQRIPNGRSFTASPWAADGRVYFLNEFGTTFVYQAEGQFELLHTNQLPEDEALYMATPAIAGDKLLVRSSQTLYCIGE